jgi:hypothetical protein
MIVAPVANTICSTKVNGIELMKVKAGIFNKVALRMFPKR